MAVSSPYAVFRAADLGWPEASPSAQPFQDLSLTLALRATPLPRSRSQPVAKARRRPACHTFVQGTLFSPALFAS